jgi:hypothetical protein
MNTPAKENYYPTGPWLVTIEEGFTCEAESGERISYDPATIQRIVIVTNDSGPSEEDVFWKLEFSAGYCYYPSSADEDGAFMALCQSLNGFDNEAVIQSMTSSQNAVFVAWDKNGL